MGTLLLTEKDVEPLVSMKEVMDVVEDAFKEKAFGRVQMPAKSYIFYKKYNGDFRAMPSYLENFDTSAVKLVNVHPDNPVKHNLPSIMAIIILIDPKTGCPLAIMDGTHITSIRTGAAGGIAAKYLSKKDVGIIGMIGAGRQARTQLMALLTLYKKLDEVKVYDISKVNRGLFVKETSELYSDVTKIVPVETAKEAVEESDIIITVTPSREPIVKDGWAKEDAHFNCIGADAPGKQELDPMILKSAKIVVDDLEQAMHGGEINVPFSKGLITESEIHGEIGEIVAGLKLGRVSSDRITVFCATGLAIQDAVTTKLVYDRAIKRGIGQEIQFVSV
ncbi:MAG: alanine dehydrogenase [Candidatus Methylarchaceae archaeon HK01B]|nr:alanine dehydrogenase [Candidatus Methylarchaceae archaeon HK01M]MCP8319304.1 alanine dehydrogenase [Candidatus Methylarchaceae archaeon HK01B]